MKNRACVIRYSFFPHHAHVLKDVEALMADGYEVDVICLQDKGEKRYESSPGLNIYRLPINRSRRGVFRYVFQYFYFTLLVFFRLTCLSLARRYKVVEVDSPPDFVVFAAVVPKILGAKIVLYIFDHIPEIFREKYAFDSRSIVIRLLNLIEKFSAHWADHVITVNDLCRKLMENKGVRHSKISVVLNVPDDAVFNNQVVSDNGSRGFRVVTHGSMLQRYGVQTLIKAVPLLIREIKDVSVEVIGDGEYREQLEELSKSLNVEKYVTFTGYIPHQQVPARIAQAHVGVICLLAENDIFLPNKLFEYMGLAKPIVCTSLPAISAYFDSKSLMFYEPGNEQDLARCILELYNNQDKREALAKSSVINYEKYRWSVMKKEYLKVYKGL